MPESIRIGERIVKATLSLGLFWAIAFHSVAFAAFERTSGDPQSAAMAGVGLAKVRAGAFLANPAVACGRNLSIWWERPFGLQELSSNRLNVSLPVGEWGTGVSFVNLGDSDYREQSAIASASYPLHERVRAGLSGVWHHLGIAGLPSGSAMAFNAGVLGEIAPDLSAGIAWNNLLGSGLSNYEDKLPSSVAVGLLLQADSRTEVGLEMEQQPGWPAEVRIGVAGRVLKPLVLRGGARFNPAEYTTGFSVKHRGIGAHYALLWHSDLGASHLLGLDVYIP